MRWISLLVIAGCGSSGASDTDGGPPGGTCGPAACAANACGSTLDDCGQTIDCGLCRYDAETIATTSFGNQPIALAGGTTVAYGTTIATRGTPWSTAMDAAPGNVLDFAIAPDGTPWAIAIGPTGELVAGTATGGAWTWTHLATDAGGAALALAADGTPYVAFEGSGGTHPSAIQVAHFVAASGWAIDYVADSPDGAKIVALAVGAGGPWVAWHDEAHAMLLAATLQGGAYTVETVDPMDQDDDPIGVAVDATGPHVLYRINQPLDRRLMHAARDASGWHLEKILDLRVDDTNDLHVALSPAGEVAVAFVHGGQLLVSARTGARWYTQLVAAACEEGPIDVAYAADGTLAVAHTCRSQLLLIERTATRFPDTQLATCKAIAAALCPAACACDSHCPIQGPQGNQRADPEGFCEELMTDAACGDATLDPAVAPACEAAIGALPCNATMGVDAPAACAFPLY